MTLDAGGQREHKYSSGPTKRGKCVFSVVIPTYNRARVVSRAIQSVLAQTIDDWELLVVDDGSVDGTEQTVLSFHDARIRYCRHQSNRGASAARNTGILRAQGEYVAFLDSDDEWKPSKLRRSLDAFSAAGSSRLACVISGKELIDETGRRHTYAAELRGHCYERLLADRAWYLSTSLLVVRRGALSDCMFDESCEPMEDWDFLLRLSKQWTIDSVSEPLVIQYRNDGGEHLFQGRRVLLGRLRILDKYHEELRRQPVALARHHRIVAGLYYRSADMNAVRRHLRRAIAVHRSPSGLCFFLAASVPGKWALRVAMTLSMRLSAPFVARGLLSEQIAPFR